MVNCWHIIACSSVGKQWIDVVFDIYFSQNIWGWQLLHQHFALRNLCHCITLHYLLVVHSIRYFNCQKIELLLFDKCLFIQSASTYYCEYFTFIVLLILIHLLMCSCVYRLVYENFYTHVVILYNAHCLQIVMPALMMMPRHHKLRS